jgi:hypothetical protein
MRRQVPRAGKRQSEARLCSQATLIFPVMVFGVGLIAVGLTAGWQH